MTRPNGEAGEVSEREPVQPVEHRKWWPLAFVDEDMPSGSDAPDGFLSVDFVGGSVLRAPDDPEYELRSLFEGDVVEFVCRDSLGASLLTLDANGGRWDPPVPAACNNLWDGDESVADSPSEFEGFTREAISFGAIDADDRIIARLSRWSTAQLRFRFTALNGPPRFVPLDPIPEPPGIYLVPPADLQTDLFRAAQAQEQP